VARYSARNDLKRMRCALHYVARASAVNMYVDKTGRDRVLSEVQFFGARRRRDFSSSANREDATIFDHNPGIGDFFSGSEGARGANDLMMLCAWQ
jgi:hypothetical protein